MNKSMLLLTIKYAGENSKRIYKSHKKAMADFENIINDIQSKGRGIRKIQDGLCIITSKSGQYELGKVLLESVIVID